MSAPTVLVVDYHPEVSTVVRAALAHAHFDVVTASTCEQALGILEAQPVDLVISEALMLLGLSGPDLVRIVKQASPSTAVMLMTGFAEEPLDPAIPLLEKPFAAATLVARVQRLLAETQRLRATVATAAALQGELEIAIRETRRRRAALLCARLHPTILVAEDDIAGRDATCRHLTRAGANVLEASNGAEALHLSRTHAVDVLLTDVDTPALNGLELARTVAAESPRTAIFLMTCEDRPLPYPAVRKPFELPDLLALLTCNLH